jgi:hypothetical protein
MQSFGTEMSLKTPLASPKMRQGNNINMDLWEISYEDGSFDSDAEPSGSTTGELWWAMP